ncbi:hypothetical protein CMUS01_11005 [Colletotrichum musicola]|uniref:Uncharacterized protein n=1 Tax=Colletotrichum musicola TaxID=2175873 RepID=A0A8H6K1B4_9PEZI|nr:hypothetical protein CMUS01_11005 [Colletotrichum musicola]
MPQPVGAPIYDPAWYQGNSREDPATAPVQPIIDPQDVEGKTTYSKRSKDQWAKYIAQQGRGRPQAPLIIENPPPPKLGLQGCWEYIEYVPEWTDPMWHDSQLEVERNDGSQYLVRPHDMLRYLRPAQLPQDRLQNPTAMATRYGIYPDRRDGRSRMTPTRQAFSRFAVNGTKPDEFNGRFVWGQVNQLAQNEGMDVDDLLKKYSSLTKDEARMLPGVHQFALLSMVQMQDDEDWQRALLQGLSTNEVRGVQLLGGGRWH